SVLSCKKLFHSSERWRLTSLSVLESRAGLDTRPNITRLIFSRSWFEFDLFDRNSRRYGNARKKIRGGNVPRPSRITRWRGPRERKKLLLVLCEFKGPSKNDESGGWSGRRV